MADRLDNFKQLIEKELTSSIKDIPVGTGKLLTLTEVSLNDPDRTLSAELKAKLGGQTHGTAVRGHFILKDTINNKETKVTKRLFKLPIKTNRNTYIWNGNEIILKNQYRRKPGVYVSQDPSGGYSAAFNMAMGSSQFDQKVGVQVEPESGKIIFKVRDSKYSLYAVMRAFNISDNDIREAMGPKLFRINHIETVNTELKKIAKKLTGKSYASFVEDSEAIREKFEGVSFTGGSNEITLGKGHETITSQFWVDVVKKLRKTVTGVLKVDDVNASYFREYLEPDDNIIESIKASALKFKTRVRRRSGKKDLKGILSATKFDKPISDIFSGGSLKDFKDQNNPMDWISGSEALTVFGPGGISQSRAVSDSMRSLQNTLFGVADPLATPESADKVGVGLQRATALTIKNNEPHIKVKTPQGKNTTISALEFQKLIIGIGAPTTSGFISGIVKGIPKQIQASTAKYFIKEEGLFSTVTNMIPMLSSTYGVRANVGNKQLGQAVPLKYREAPLVETEFSKSMEGKPLKDIPSMDMQGNIIAVISGTVQAVRKETIVIKGADGKDYIHEIPKDFPLNAESFMDNSSKVKVGDVVRKGQILAESVFSKEGKLAIGTNLKTGFLAYKGYNFEDGFVVSETAAKKMTSLHLMEFVVEKGKEVVVGKKEYISVFPNAAMTVKLENYDENGVIKKGTSVENGDLLILAYEKRDLSPSQASIALLNKKVAQLLAPRDISPIFDKEAIGKVSRIHVDNKNVKVFVKTEEVTIEGDKIATRYGGKGIITKILPDAQMPMGEDGTPLEVLFNPHGIPSRMNSSQLVESSLGKIAKAENNIYTLPQFSKEGYVDMAQEEQRRSGIHDEETVIDPETGKKLEKVHVGQLYFNKLKQSVRTKIKAGETGYYDVTYDRPKKTSTNGTRAIDGLSFYSLLAGGARKNLADMANIKGTRNDEFWRALNSGLPLPEPKAPAIRDNFLSSLQALGLNVNQTKSSLAVTPSTNEDILKRSNGEITEAKFIRSRDMKPEPGGFYDPILTGGSAGDKWTHISLAEEIPNPIFETAITKTLGLTSRKFADILKGKTKVNGKGEIDEKGSLFGGKAIATMLDSINLNTRIKELREEGKQFGKDKDWASLNSNNTKLRFLTNIKTLGKKPSELYTLKSFPILPPKFRQMTILPDGTVQNPPLNELYQSLKLESDGINKLKAIGFDDPDLMGERINELYKHTGAILGTTDPVSFQLKQRAGEKGLLRSLAPKSGGKFGTIQSKMLSKTQDISGGSTITVDPTLPLDNVGIPEDMAYKIMKPFITRKLVSAGYTPIKAMETINERSPIARAKLDEVMNERPVLLNRHPSLHKFNFMSQWGHVTSGKAIELNPLVIHGFNADFDGDSMIGDIWLSAPGEHHVDCGDHIVKTKLAVTTNISEIPHGELIEQRGNKEVYEVPKGMTVPAISPEGFVELKEITKFHKHRACKEWEVELTGGVTLNVSDNHSLVCYNPDLSIVEKTRPEDALNMCVPRLFDYDPINPNVFEGIEDFEHQVHLDLISCLGFFSGSIRKNKGRVGGYYFGNTPFMTTRLSLLNRHTEAYLDEERRFISPFVIEWINDNIHLEGDIRLPSFLVGVSKKHREAFIAGILESVINPKRREITFRATTGRSYLEDISKIAQSVGVDSNITSSIQNKTKFYELDFKIADVKEFFAKNADYFTFDARNYIQTDDTILSASKKKHDFIPVPTHISLMILETIRFRVDPKDKANHLRYAYNIQPYSEWINLGYEPWLRTALDFFLSYMTEEELAVLPNDFKDLCMNDKVRWGRVERSESTGRVINMYDITVEKHMNFAADGGYFVWDTMNVHVPVTEGARLEAAKKLMPSKSLFGPNRKILPMPSNEALLGLYILSKKGGNTNKSFANLTEAENSFLDNEINIDSIVKISGVSTTLGWGLLHKAIPDQYHSLVNNKIVDKVVIQNLIKSIYKDDPSRAATMLNSLKDLGNKYAYLTGFSISLNDIAAPKAMMEKVKKLTSTLGKDNKNADKYDANISKLQTEFKSYFDTNRIYDMKRSGAKGSWGNISQMLATPGFMEGKFGTGTQERAIGSGYAQGMKSDDYLNTLFAARSGVVSKTRGVAKGGELSKDEVHASMEAVITEKDCFTIKGINMDRTDRFILGRFTSRGAKLIDEQFLKSNKSKQFLVRSPLTCESTHGMCGLCHGLNDQMTMPNIGDHVGVEAAQVTSEKITQGLLRSFHSGKGAGDGGALSLEKQVSNLFGKIPGTFSNEAPIAKTSEIITKVDKSAGGGWDIFTDNDKYYATDLVDPIVKKGDSVSAGEALTTGVKHPRKVLEVEGLLGVRKYLTNSMRNLYSSTGVDLNPVHFEILSKSLTEHARVLDGGDSKYEPGDMEKVSVLEKENKKGSEIKYEARIEGAHKIPVLRNDFLAQSARREARTAIPEAAIKGFSADIHGINPLNSWLLGDFKQTPGSKGAF
jgi:DNA-directed RNA polymerase beta subunit/DNA-directed RNA polymerase beta' subunit